MYMLSTIYSLSALLLSFAVLTLGHGLHNTVIGVRATLEHYPEWVMGFMTSAYFVGYILGTHLCSKLISIVGQIRTFIAFASIASSISLFHAIFVNEVTWIILRLIYGACMAALYLVIESWLNSLASPKYRGRLLSIYMVINFLCLALGQLFLFFGDPQDYILFAVVSILISISLVPLTVSRTEQPVQPSSEPFSLRRLIKISPLATLGCLATGLTLGAFWGLGAVYFKQMGLSSSEVALAMSAIFVGSLVSQWPIGYCSDFFNRRIVISGVLFMSILVCFSIIFFTPETNMRLSLSFIITIMAFGGFNYTLYSLFIALANDFLNPTEVVKASVGLLNLHAIGAIFGPVIAALFMIALGNKGLFTFMVAVNIPVLAFAIIRILKGRTIPEETTEPFVSMPRTGAGVFALLYPKKKD